jgi:hypothetical protein
MVTTHKPLFKINEQVLVNSQASDWRGKVAVITVYHEKSRRYGVKRGNEVRYFLPHNLVKACPFGMKSMQSSKQPARTREKGSTNDPVPKPVVVEDVETDDEDSYTQVQYDKDQGMWFTPHKHGENQRAESRTQGIATPTAENHWIKENELLRSEVKRLNAVVSELAEMVKSKLDVNDTYGTSC